MSRIKLTNSCIMITNYSENECSALEKNFMKWNPMTHKFDTFGMYYDKEYKTLYLPRGLDLYKIRGYLNEKYYDKIDPNPYQTIDKILMRYPPRDDEQKTALRFMCCVNEFEENIYQPQLCLSLATGKGKSKKAAEEDAARIALSKRSV